MHTYPDTIAKSVANLFFIYGFDSDRVKVYLNGNIIYNKKIKIDANGPSGQVSFKKEKENTLQIQINGSKTKEFKFDKKYNTAMIEWYQNTEELKLVYQNFIFLFD